MSLTICYITCRGQPLIHWALDSLHKEICVDNDDIVSRIVVVDFYNDYRDGDFISRLFNHPLGHLIVRTPVKPSVWQGPNKLTREDWFAASNCRNSGLCLCNTEWVGYLDDLSVLVPGWLSAAKEAISGNYIALGAYKKVKNLVVEKGEIKSFTEFPGGIDSRWSYGSDTGPVPASGGMMYGCSVVMPVEALLTINGWPEDLCDGLGSEDYCCGIALENAGYTFKYDRRLLTLESEEHHHIQPPFRRDDWHFENGIPVRGGNGGNDKSHAALNIAKQSKHFPNHFNIREMRERVLRGEPFPVDRIPENEWFTGIPLRDL